MHCSEAFFLQVEENMRRVHRSKSLSEVDLSVVVSVSLSLVCHALSHSLLNCAAILSDNVWFSLHCRS